MIPHQIITMEYGVRERCVLGAGATPHFRVPADAGRSRPLHLLVCTWYRWRTKTGTEVGPNLGPDSVQD
jgi:hypothetical protein